MLGFTGCNVSVRIAGPKEGDAKRYASAIDAWRQRAGLPGDVLWSQEDEGAVASFQYRPGKFGDSSGKTPIDVDPLRTAVMSVEPKVQFALIDTAWSRPEIAVAPDVTASTGIHYWNLTNRPRIGTATGSIHLPGWLAPLLLLWILLPPVGIIVCLLTGVRIARNESIPIKVRRLRYGKIVSGGTSAVLGFHGLLVTATLPTRVFEPMTQLWFGLRFTQIGLVLVPILFILPIFVLQFVSKKERLLLAPTSTEKESQLEEMLPLRKIIQTRAVTRKRFVIPLFLFGAALQVASSLLSETNPYRNWVEALGLLAVLGVFPILRSTRKGMVFEVDEDSLAGLTTALKERVARLSAIFGVAHPPTCIVTEVAMGRFNAYITRKNLGVTVHAVEQLEPQELDFVIAYELAHLKLGHVRIRALQTWVPILLVIPLPMIAFGSPVFSVSTPGFFFTPLLIPLALAWPYSLVIKRSRQQQEFAADRLAVEVTGNVRAATTALRRMALNSTSPGIHDMDVSAHPTISARIAALENRA